MANVPDDKDFATGDPTRRPEQRSDRADDAPRKVPSEDPKAGTRDVKRDPEFHDQSQGPNHPLDDSGHKRQ